MAKCKFSGRFPIRCFSQLSEIILKKIGSLAGRVFAVVSGMQVGIPERQGRVSPVFDSARHLWIFRIENGRPAGRMTTLLYSRDPLNKARQVALFGVDLLICGTISRPLHIALSSAGVKVRPCICGAIEEVFQAYCSGCLSEDRFQMPGTRSRKPVPGESTTVLWQKAGTAGRRPAINPFRINKPVDSAGDD